MNQLCFRVSILYACDRTCTSFGVSGKQNESMRIGVSDVITALTTFVFLFAVDKSGDVCISILHEPGDDKYGYEKASERWLPVHTVETILISVISMLADPNDESPANVDAAKEWRENYQEFKRKVARCVRKSQEDCL